MTFKGFSLRQAVVLIAVLLSGMLYYLSTGLEGFRLLVWIAPVPVLVYSLQAPRLRSFFTAWMVYFIGLLNLAAFLFRVVPLPVIVITDLLVSGIFAFAVLGFRYATLKYNNFLPPIFFAAAWTSWEFLLSLISPHGTFLSLAYTQSDFLPMVQIASVTGIPGITFLLLFVPAGMVTAWHHRKNKLRAVQWALAPCVLLFLVFSTGFIRIHQPVRFVSFRAGLAASDTSVRYFATDNRKEAMAVIGAFENGIAKLASAGARIIVLPEKMIGVTAEYHDEFMKRLIRISIRNKIFLVAGLNEAGPPKNRNAATVISPSGSVVCDYDKRYFIPGAETGYFRGSKPGLFDMMDIPCGVEICKDMDFPAWSRKYGKAGVQILFVPAWDFTADGWLHSRMAKMRAIENGFSLVRCAQQGYLSVMDYRGKVISETTTGGKPGVLLEGDVFPGPGKTIYSRTGDWFAWMNVIFVALVLLVPVTRSFWNKK